MFYKKIVFIVFITFYSTLIAQTKNQEWQIGVSASVTRFADKDTGFIGDKHQIQIPRLNVTKPLSENSALDLAISFNNFDLGFIKNTASYLSIDTSYRYFLDIGDMFFPYAFAGLSLTDTDYDVAIAANIGAGATFWINETFGLNGQVYYKHPFSDNNMRGHIQVSGGMVFALNLFDLFHNGSKSNGFCR